jgi:hypothetical protein
MIETVNSCSKFAAIASLLIQIGLNELGLFQIAKPFCITFNVGISFCFAL